MYGMLQRVDVMPPQVMLCLLLSNTAIICALCILLSMQARGLTPQLFLSASHLANHQQAAAAAKAGSSSSSTRRRSSIIPAAAREVLEVFVMQKQELFTDLQQQQDAAASSHTAADSTLSSSSRQNDSESNVNDEIQARIEALGLSMAVLTTFVRLLELKLVQMEGEEGTGGALLHCHCYSLT
jgi:hypothetical protein